MVGPKEANSSFPINQDPAVHAASSTKQNSHTRSRTNQLFHYLAPTLLIISQLLSSSTAHAYRTAGELEEFDGTERVRYRSDLMLFQVHSDLPSELSYNGVIEMLRQAQAEWEAPMCSSLEMEPNGATTRDATPGDGVNTIQWITDWSSHGFDSDQPGITDVQYATNEDGDWEIEEADIYLNGQDFKWRLQGYSEDKRDVLRVLTHELGHAAGLMHPCEPDGADDAPRCSSKESFKEVLMYPIYGESRSVPNTDDKRGLCFLYEQETCEDLGCPTGEKCTDTGCQPLCGDSVCEGLEQCIDDECIVPCTDPSCGDGEGSECKKDRDCPDYLSCQDKVCVTGTLPLGDPCLTSADCESGACTRSGYCAPSCEKDDDCTGPDEECNRSLGELRACEGKLKAAGETCKGSADCLGGQCIADAIPDPVCTRLCGHQYEDCPNEWTCETVDNREVCVPPQHGTSCAVFAIGANTSPRRGTWVAQSAAKAQHPTTAQHPATAQRPATAQSPSMTAPTINSQAAAQRRWPAAPWQWLVLVAAPLILFRRYAPAQRHQS